MTNLAKIIEKLEFEKAEKEEKIKILEMAQEIISEMEER